MFGDSRRLALLPVILFLGLLMLPLYSFAAQTGQIKGTITDSETGEKVIGASVAIVGTSFGAQTNLDGWYMISRLEPGKYDIMITSVGYNPLEVTGVTVNADLTTEQSHTLEKSVSDIGITQTVVGKQDILDRYETAGKLTISAEEIKSKPVQNVESLLEQVAGIQTTSSGEVYIRGGRAGEVSYIVDGVPIGDPLAGGQGAGAALSLVSGSISEIQIIKDGFDPEYGNALSGIVKITSATGSKDNTRINFQFTTDDLGNRSLNKYSRNNDYYVFSVSGPDPLFKDKILPALGLNFLEDKEFTYYVYAEMDKHDGIYQYDSYDTRSTRASHDAFSLFGIDIGERLTNSYYWIGNLKFRPKPNLKFILSYKDSRRNGTGFMWDYRYTAATAPVWERKWRSLSLEVSQAVSKDLSYEFIASYYKDEYYEAPGDPNNPGHGLNPDQFAMEADWERYADLNGNGTYDAPEPLINLFADSAGYGTDFNGPAYTFSEFQNVINVQGGEFSQSDFRFNTNGYIDNLEGEPFIDLNGNGVWDAGDQLYDKNGNGLLDADRAAIINVRKPEPWTDGDEIIGEPFTDVNHNGVYDRGVDIFVMDVNPVINNDLNHNGQYDGPCYGSACSWEPGIPFVDNNGNGLYDRPNFQYDPGEPFTDVNGNGTYDRGGQSDFLSPGTYDTDIDWHQRYTERWRAEMKIFRQMGNHELKLGGAIIKEDFSYEDIDRPYLLYTGRADGGAYGDRGAFRDMWSYSPLNGTVYFRDKLEYGSMIASLGLRWDFFLQDTEDLAEIAVIDDLRGEVILGDRHKVSPRIGFSYPISDKAKVHFNYGHFFQQPPYLRMYQRNTQSADQNSVVGNYNLDYEKTIQYSFGVKYALNENYSVDMSAYFKDEFDKINTAEIRTSTGLTRQQYRNKDYGRSKGFEIQLDKRGGGYVNGQINYTYAFADGKASQTNDDYLSDFYLSREPLSESPLANDIRHSFKAGIQIYVPTTVKPRLFGLPIPNGWSLWIESVVESGKPYTPDATLPYISQTEESIGTNSMRYPATAVFDIRLNKDFDLAGLDLTFIFWVENVFDQRNVETVYTNTGRPDTRQNISGVIFGGTAYDLDPYNWDYGRQVRVGMEVNL